DKGLRAHRPRLYVALHTVRDHPTDMHGNVFGSSVGHVSELWVRERKGFRGHDGRRRGAVAPKAALDHCVGVELGAGASAPPQSVAQLSLVELLALAANLIDVERQMIHGPVPWVVLLGHLPPIIPFALAPALPSAVAMIHRLAFISKRGRLSGGARVMGMRRL